MEESVGKRFMALVEQRGTDNDHPDLAAAARRVNLGSMVDVGLLLVVVWAMVARPML